MDVARYVIVGAGRAGVGVGLALAESGLDVVFMTRRPVPWIGQVRACRAGDASLPRGAACFVLAVPDHVIPDVADAMIRDGMVTAESVVGHLSGALPSSIIPGEIAGRFSAHPLLSFPLPSPPRRMPAGTPVMVEGDPVGAGVATAALRKAGAVVAPITEARKPLCHAAAVAIANLPAVLLFPAADILRECGVPDALIAASRLLASAASNVAANPGPTALTGPFARGDIETIAANRAALESKDADLAYLYRELGIRLASLLRDNRTLSEAKWRSIIEMLRPAETGQTPK